MCQLTLLDIDPKTKLGKATIRNLIELNQQAIAKFSPQSNEDGFGYMTFAKAPEITKTGKSAGEWWHENWENYQKSVRNPNGMYHVRAASNNVSTIFEDDAHPFHHGHIVLAHNGTMSEDKKLENDEVLQKLFETADPKEPMIDSEKFCALLANICGDEKLEKEHIVLAMEYFHGPFAMLIYDTKQPKKMFIVRGKDRPLHCATLYKDKRRGEKIGMVLNTHLYELMYWSKMVKSISKEYLGLNLHIGIQILAEESIFEYEIGSYDVGEPVEEIKQTTQTYVYPARQINHVNHHRSSSTNFSTGSYNDRAQSYVDIYGLCADLEMTLSELLLLAEYINGVCLQAHTADDLENLRSVLIKLSDFDFEGRKKTWTEFLKENKVGAINVYKNCPVSFPYILMSKKLLKKNLSEFKIPAKQ